MPEDISKLRIEKSPGKGYRRRKWRPAYWGAALLLLFLSGYLAFRTLSVTQVRAAEVSVTYPSEGLTVLNASGYVEAERKAALSSKITGRLVWLGVEEGSPVEKGQIVARLESADLEAALDEARASLRASRDNMEAARAELDDARSDYRRKKELMDMEFIARSVFDAAGARLKKAEAAFEAARAGVRAAEAAERGASASLGFTEIRAPFSGVVLTKNADIGDIVTPVGAAADAKAAVVTVADMDTLYVEADISEANIGKVYAGMPCEIELDSSPGEKRRGSVHMIVPTADRTKASVMVKVRFLDGTERVLPEMSAKVAFLSRAPSREENKPLPTVPGQSIVSEEGRDFVFIIDGERAGKKEVRTGKRIGEAIEVSGVEPGTRIVLAPPEGLEDGSKIEVIEE
ncbi:MAG: efflux RND transporter periplasmic adaptor subunit [Thermodesulfobacteriota bacterium]|nr:MAG: efflux RND transporter periplasmic adaptor subunit [Thermodesulfobacteriota bacterium]